MDDWETRQWLAAKEISKEYRDKITSKEDLDNLIVDLMIKYGPDRHCDGHEIMAEIIWQKLVDDKCT